MISEEKLEALAGFDPMSMGISFEYIDGPNQHAVFIGGDEENAPYTLITLPELRELARDFLKLRRLAAEHLKIP
jgi:hypothetical protein